MHDKNIDCGIPLKIFTRKSEGQLKVSDFIHVSGVAKQNWEKVKERDSGGHLCSERLAGRFSSDSGNQQITRCAANPGQGQVMVPTSQADTTACEEVTHSCPAAISV